MRYEHGGILCVKSESVKKRVNYSEVSRFFNASFTASVRVLENMTFTVPCIISCQFMVAEAFVERFAFLQNIHCIVNFFEIFWISFSCKFQIFFKAVCKFEFVFFFVCHSFIPNSSRSS